MAPGQGGVVSQQAVERLLPGRRLREGRERAGLTEEQVARRLHMSLTFVRAIEADDYERLPEAAFIKGYMRNYARLVDVPADEVANLFQQMIEEEGTQPSEPGASPDYASELSAPKSSLRWVVPLFVVLVALGWWLSQDRSVSDDSAEQSEQQEVVLLPESEQSLPELEATPEAESESQVPAEAAEEAVEAVAEDVVEPVADQLRVSFNGPCWVQVLDASGETLFSGQQSEARALELSGLGPFRLTFGNGAAVAELTVNNQPVSVPPSAPGNVVRVTAP